MTAHIARNINIDHWIIREENKRFSLYVQCEFLRLAFSIRLSDMGKAISIVALARLENLAGSERFRSRGEFNTRPNFKFLQICSYEKEDCRNCDQGKIFDHLQGDIKKIDKKRLKRKNIAKNASKYRVLALFWLESHKF
jgi:hypothetical protein